MRLRIIALEERVVLDASGVHELYSLDDHFSDFDHLDSKELFLAEQVALAKGAHVLVISSEVQQPEEIISAAHEDVEIIYYDANKSTLESLAEDIKILLDGQKASSIAFVNHGGEGRFDLTKDQSVSSASLQNQDMQDFWKNVGKLVEEDGRIDLLACSLAANTEGLDLIEGLEKITGLDVAASTDDTGHHSLGGDWILETDGIDATLLYFDAGLIESWESRLNQPLASDFSSGSALSFDGIDDKVVIPYQDGLLPEANLSFEAFVKTNPANSGSILHSSPLRLSQSGTSLFATIESVDGEAVLEIENALDDQWTHIALSYDGSLISVYLDGNLAATKAHTGLLLNNSDIILASSDQGDPLNLQIDEMRLWDKALSAQEVLDSHNKVLTATEEGLLGYWRFSAKEGSTLYDFSGNGFNGNLEGSIASSAVIEGIFFDTSRQGWTTMREDTSLGLIYHFAEGGNSGGYISSYDFSPSDNFFTAPFKGDFSAASLLTFDLKQSGGLSLESTKDIIIRSGQEELHRDIQDPGLDWTSYSFSMQSGWKKSDGSDASSEEIQSVLGALDSLQIRAEYSSEFAVTDLDNLVIEASGTPLPSWVNSRAAIEESFQGLEDNDQVIFLRGLHANETLIKELPQKGSLLQFDESPITSPDTLVTDPMGRVIFRPDAEDFGEDYAQFSFQQRSAAQDTPVHPVKIHVESVNDAPYERLIQNVQVDEGSEVIIKNSHVLFEDDIDSSFLSKYRLESLPTNGHLERLGVSLQAGDEFSQADIDRDRIVYIHDDSETTEDSFNFSVADNEGSRTDTKTLVLNIARVNDAPPQAGGDTSITDLSDAALNVLEDQQPEAANIRLNVPNLFDTDTIAPQNLRIVSVLHGQLLQADGSEIVLGTSGSDLAISDGNVDLRFIPDQDFEETASFRYVLVDADDTNLVSEESEVLIPMQAINDAPILSSTLQDTNLVYQENSGFVPLDPSISLSDVDIDEIIYSASISIKEGFNPQEDALSLSTKEGLVTDFDPQTGVLSISGAASKAVYEKVLRSATYHNRSEDPQTHARIIEIGLADVSESSNLIKREINVQKIDDAPKAIDQGPGSALIFDGHNDFVDLGSFELGGDLSFELWFYADKPQDSYSRLFDFSNGADEDSIVLSFNESEGKLIFLTRNGSESKSLTTSDAIAAKTWTHVAASIEGTNGKIYINGQLAAEGELFAPALLSRENQFLGNSLNEGARAFDGQIDEMRIWNKALNAEEIGQKYTKRVSGDEADLIGYWRFDEDFGQRAQDLAGTHHAKLGDKEFRFITASQFESDSDGWMVTAAGGTLLAPTHQTVGGHGGGYISLSSPDATWSYWQAPEKFLGDKSAAYGGLLNFSLRDQGAGENVEQPDLFLRGAGLELKYELRNQPGSDWKEFSVALHESSGWIESGTGLAPSKAQMESVLSDLQNLKIRGEFLSGNDTFHLDSVALLKSDSPTFTPSEAGVEDVIVVEEHSETPIDLGGSDAEFNPIQAKITRLARLFQFSHGIRGASITNDSRIVTDPLLRVFFQASTSTITSFGFTVSDENHESQEANVNIEVLAVNNAPVISLPENLPLITEDAKATISGISVSDVDVNETENAKMIMTLWVDHGRIDLGDNANLAFLQNDGLEDKSVTIRGSLDAINNAIQNIHYKSDLNYTGNETLHLRVDDEGNTGSGGALVDNKTIEFFVNPANDAPTLTGPKSVTAIEDQRFDFSGITVDDLDIVANDTSPLKITISTTNGTLAIADDERAKMLQFEESLDALKDKLANLNYLSDANYHGPDNVQILVEDQSSIGSGGMMQEQIQIAVSVEPANDAPILDVPPEQVIDEDQSLTLPPIVLSDPLDAGPGELALYELQVSVQHGTLSLSNTSNLLFTEGSGVQDRQMTMKGSIAAINEAFNALSYRGDLHYHGPDQVLLSVSDLGFEGQGDLLTDTASVSIDVQSVNDPYVINVPSSLAVEEGNTLNVPDVFISDIDLLEPNEIDPASVNVELTLEVSEGVVIIGQNQGAFLQLSSSLAELNDALSGLQYLPNGDFKGSDNLVIKILENDQCVAESAIFLTIDAVNDAPVVVVPGAQTTNEDSDLNISGFSVSDLDLAETVNAKFDVRVKSDHGSIFLNQLQGLAFETGFENGNKNLHFTGSNEAVNAAIASMRYSPELHFNGSDSLVVTVNDLGNSGLGGPKEHSMSVAIEVEAVNDAPVLTLAPEQFVLEDETLNITGVSVHDLDINEQADTEVFVLLSVGHGRIELGNVENLNFETQEAKEIGFFASIEAANAALADIRYTADQDYNGRDDLVVEVNDQGFSGALDTQGSRQASGALTDNGQIRINVGAVNDAPILTNPQEKAVFEDEESLISGIFVADVDVNENLDALMSAQLEVSFGTLKLTELSGIDMLFDSGKELRFEGSLSSLNAALASVKYTSDLHYHSDQHHAFDSLEISITDKGNTGIVQNSDSNILSSFGSISIPVMPVNDAPSLNMPTSGEVLEDGMLLINVDLDDRDIFITPDIELSLDLSVSHGTLKLSLQEGLIVSGNESASLSISGKVPAINAALDHLQYHPNDHYHGPDLLQVDVTDQGNTGQGDILFDNASMNLTVQPVNDQPVLTVPGLQTITEDQAFAVEGIFLTEHDITMQPDIELELRLSVSHGVLSVDPTNLSSIEGNAEKEIVMQGTLPALNNALSSLSYLGDLHYHDADQIVLDVRDLGNISQKDPGGFFTQELFDHAVIDLDVKPVNDAPELTVPGTQVIDEEELLTITGIAIDDRDITRRPDIILELRAEVEHGSISLASRENLNFIQESDKIIVVRGKLAALNIAVESIDYRGDLNYHGPDQLTLSIDDLGNVQEDLQALQDQETISIDVLPINDKPLWSLPGTQVVAEEQELIIQGISFSDADILMDDSIEFEASLSVENGRISLQSTQGIQILEGANGQAALTFKGSLAAINAALSQGLAYEGDTHFHDSDNLRLFISDLGNISQKDQAGDPVEVLTDEQFLEIFVTPINDAPTLIVPEAQTLFEDEPLAINGVSIDDRDIVRRPNMLIKVNLDVSHGFLSMQDREAAPSHEIIATVPEVNALLATLSYQGEPNYHDSDQIVISVDDLGNVGTGNVLETQNVIDLELLPMNDKPSIQMLNDQSVLEDHALIIEGISVADVDILRDENIQLKVALNVNHGSIQLAQSEGIAFSSNESGQELIFRGTVPALNAAIHHIHYQGDENFHGTDTLQVFVSDEGNIGQGDILSETKSLYIHVEGVNDMPTLQLPADKIVREDTLLRLEDFFVDDKDTTMDPNINMELKMNVSHGQLSLAGTADLQFLEGTGTNDSSITLRGTVSAINAALAHVDYLPDLHYHGEDAVFVSIDDLGNTGHILPPVEGVISLIVVDSNVVSIESINDPVDIALPEIPVAEEDLFVSIPGIVLADPDTELSPEMEIDLILSAAHGKISINPAEAQLRAGNPVLDESLSLRGTVTQLNQALETLAYKSNENYNQNLSLDHLTVEVNDRGNSGVVFFPDGIPENVRRGDGEELITEKDLVVIVQAVNDAPELTLPEEILTATEDLSLAISGIHIDDVDANENPDALLQVRIEAKKGTLTLQEKTGLVFETGDGIEDEVLLFKGRLEDLNTSLASLEYKAHPDYNSTIDGNEVIDFLVNDLANTGLGTELKASGQMEIEITAVNDAPRGIELLNEALSSPFSGYTAIANLDTVDPDFQDDSQHSYTLLQQAESDDFILHGKQLLIANNALLNFQDQPTQSVSIRTEDPYGESFEQNFILSDHELSAAEKEGLPDDVKYYVNQAIAKAARNLRGILSINSWSDHYQPLDQETSDSSPLDEALTALNDSSQQTTQTEESASTLDRFAGLLRARSSVIQLPSLLRRFF